jgi:hypothetical protein
MEITVILAILLAVRPILAWIRTSRAVSTP